MGSEVKTSMPQSLLLGSRGRSVTYLLDLSEDMRDIMVSAKKLLIRTLLRKAAFRDSLFNIVTFSGKVTVVLRSLTANFFEIYFKIFKT